MGLKAIKIFVLNAKKLGKFTVVIIVSDLTIGNVLDKLRLNNYLNLHMW